MFVALLSLLSFASASTVCPVDGPAAIPAAYVSASARLEKALARFAETPEAARAADETLARLLAAKSPAITDWMRKRGLRAEDPDRVVREWRLYHARSFSLSKYPAANPALSALIEKLVEGQYREALTAAERARMKRVFAEARKFALARVAKFSLAEAGSSALTRESRDAIAERLSKVELYFMDSFKGSRFATAGGGPLDAIAWGIAYDPVPNQINVGIEALRYDGDATLFAVFAHELGHTFDPCRWGAFFEGVNPFASVVECLRDGASSVGARKRDDSKLDEAVRSGRVGADLAASLRANPACNKLQYPPPGVQADQAPESFADWFSAEVVALSPHARARGLRADLCVEKELVEGSSYPPYAMRLQRIYLAHPALRAGAGLKPEKEIRHCAGP